MKKTATVILATALSLSLSVGAYASDQAQTVIENEENGTSISIVDITPREEENKIYEKEQKVFPQYFSFVYSWRNIHSFLCNT